MRNCIYSNFLYSRIIKGRLLIYVILGKRVTLRVSSLHSDDLITHTVLRSPFPLSPLIQHPTFKMPESPRISSSAFDLDESASTNANDNLDVLDTIDLNDNDSSIDPWKASEASTSAPSPSRGTSYTAFSHSSSHQELSNDTTDPEETDFSAISTGTTAKTSLPVHWVNNGEIPTVLGIAVVDFNHLVSPFP